MQHINAHPMKSSAPSNIVLVGFGGTDSKCLSDLLNTEHTLKARGPASLHVTAFDCGEVSPAILNLQRFSDAGGRRSGVVYTVTAQPCRPHAPSPAGAVYVRQ